MPQTKISSIGFPEHYVRGKVSGQNIKDLRDIVVKAHATKQFFTETELSSGKELDWHKLIGKKLSWPFNAEIQIAKNPPPEKKDGKKESVKKKKHFDYELIDGFHRFTIWKQLKQTEIPSTIIGIKSPLDRFLEQYKTNSGHGMRLDKDARDNAVRIVHTVYKATLAQCVKDFGMSLASVKRIIAHKQRKDGPRKKPDSKKEFDTSQPLPTEMSAEEYLQRVATQCAWFPRVEKNIPAVLASIPPTKLANLVARLRMIANTLEAPLLKAEEKNAPETK